MIKYIRGLKFEETPNYDKIIKSIKLVGKAYKVKPDGNFDWIETVPKTVIEEKKEEEEEYIRSKSVFVKETKEFNKK